MDDTAPTEPIKQRRSKRRGKSGTTSGADRLRRARRAWRNWHTPAMAVATAAWAFAGYYSTYSDAASYANAGAGMTHAEARYIMGEPAAKAAAEGRERWVYHNGESRTALIFDGSGRLIRVACTSTYGSPGDCPSTSGITLGLSEDQVWYKLGVPPVQKIVGGEKIISYPAIGLTMRLSRFQVTHIVRDVKSAPLEILPSFVRMLVP